MYAVPDEGKPVGNAGVLPLAARVYRHSYDINTLMVNGVQVSASPKILEAFAVGKI